MSRLRAAVVGATGMAGQQFVLALSGHPNFEVVQMVTSRNEKANQYQDGGRKRGCMIGGMRFGAGIDWINQ